MTAEATQLINAIHWGALEEFERPSYLIKGWLNSGRFSVLYGEPGSMKTFVSLDLALSIAIAAKDADHKWRGHRVKGGPVVYVACEGGSSIEDRLRAYAEDNEIQRGDVPLYVIPQSIDLGDKSSLDVMHLSKAVEQIGGASLIIIDTLSRAIAGANENSPDAMTAFIGLVDTLREATRAHVMVIHHTGKDVERGARGHSSLKAAADTEIVVRRIDEIVQVRTSKQRDMAEDREIAFRPRVVELGADEDGDPITSVVLDETDERPTAETGAHPTATRKALKILWNAVRSEEGIPPGGDEGPPIPEGLHAIKDARWRELCLEAGLGGKDTDEAQKKAFIRARKRLLDNGTIRSSDGWVWPLTKSELEDQGLLF